MKVLLFIFAIVCFTWFGGSNVPGILKNNKEILLGIFIGIILNQYMGNTIEGAPGGRTPPPGGFNEDVPPVWRRGVKGTKDCKKKARDIWNHAPSITEYTTYEKADLKEIPPNTLSSTILLGIPTLCEQFADRLNEKGEDICGQCYNPTSAST